MALEFYLNGTQIYPIVNTTITERIGTFSDATLPLEINNIKSPFLPMSQLQIRNTGEGNWNFVIVSDEVETASKDGTLFKHNLTVRSGIFEATKHVLRNTVFSQPPKVLKGICHQMMGIETTYNSTTDFRFPIQDASKDSYSHLDINLSSRHKIAKGAIKLRTEIWEYMSVDTTNPQLLDFDTPSYHGTNTHNQMIVGIKRYDNNVLVSTKLYNFTTGNYKEINTSDSIFNNLTDKTVFRVYVESGFNSFTPNNVSNKGAVAVVDVTLELQAYYYSLFDIVEDLYYQSKKLYNGIATNDIKCLQITSDVDKVNELKSIVAPEISFNGMTYYDALYTLFSYIDAVPVVDANGYLSYEFLNNYDENKVVPTIEAHKADEKININDEYYTNKLVANYQNARQENAICYPCVNRMRRVASKDLGIPTSTSYCLKVPKPIDYIDKVSISTGTLTVEAFFQYHYDTYTVYGVKYGGIQISQLEIQDRIFETALYNSLNDNREFYEETFLLCNCLCYSRGSDYIDLLGNASLTVLTHEIYKYVIMAQLLFRFGVPSYSTLYLYNGTGAVGLTDLEDEVEDDIVDKQEITYYVEYHALYDGRVEQVSQKAKYEGETYVNQESAEVSLNKMGNNLQGLIAKLGNKVENLTLDVSSYGARMRVGSIWKTDDGEKYIANVVQTTFSTSADKVIVNAEFSKDFNLISQFTKIDQQKRFYEISEKLTTKGYENITEYVYFSYSTSMTDRDDFIKSSMSSIYMLHCMIEGTLGKISTYKCDYATFRPYTHKNDNYPSNSNYTYLPLHIYGSGNSICFEMDYDDSLNAGDRVTGDGGVDTPYYAKSTLYTNNKNGFADKVEIKLWEVTTSWNATNFPTISTVNDRNLLTIDNFYYLKKPNEIFHLNFAFAFMYESDEFFFGNEFIENNAVIRSVDKSNTKLKLYYSNNEVYSIIDNKPVGNVVTIDAFNYSQNSNNGNMFIHIGIELANSISCVSWALCDENDNLLIASNKEMSNVSEINFYVIPRRNRL